MKRYARIIILSIMFCILSVIPVFGATITPGDIATSAYDTLSKAHSYYIDVLGQPCYQCGIPAKEWVTPGDYGCGILAHGQMGDAFWIMMQDTHWLVVNGHGSTGDWKHGNSILSKKYSQSYTKYESGVHPWSGLESFPTQVIHGEPLGDIGKGTYSNLCNVTAFYWGGNECKEIDDYAFYDMNKLGSIIIDSNIVRINKQAFVLNPILENVTFGIGLERIGTRAFMNDPIKECIFPNKLKSIERAAFSGCSKLKNIKWGKAKCKVGEYAFNNCYGLGYRNVKYLPKYIEKCSTSFRNCYRVKQ